MTALAAHDIGCRLGGRAVLEGITLTADYGRVLALIGPNGAGKSTLLSVLAGDLTPSSGEVELDGRPLRTWSPLELARHRAVLLQANSVTFAFTAREVIEMGRNPWRDAEDDLAVEAAVAATDVGHLLERPFRELSGGERARVSLARVLAQETPVVLLDEPTAALDLRHQEETMRVARSLADAGRAVVVVLHDLSLAAAHADDVAVLDGGRVVAHGVPEQVFVPHVLEPTFRTPLLVLTDPDGYPVVAHRRQPLQETPMPTTRLALSTNLSAMMRDGSATEHKDAEGSAFMSELLEARVNEDGYATYLAALRPVYQALEGVGRELAGHPVAGVVVDQRLDRLPALDADLAHWSGGTTPAGSVAGAAYAARIWATVDDPALYLAHHYTRYLGDLSGGQAIGRILAREFGLADGVGVAFYEFADVPKPKPYKDDYRARLDALDLDEATKQRIVEEVKVAFNLNQALFEELSADLERFRRVVS